MAKRPRMLDPLRVRVRRLQLIVGLGLIACVLGAVISIPISFRVLNGVDLPLWLFEILRTLVSQLWAFAVLPVLLYGISRIIELKPWSAAAGSVATGVVFELAITLISRGLEGITEEHPARLVTWVLTSAAGVFIGAWAVRSARAASKRAEDEARKVAEAKKDEYAAFAREAEKIAARTEVREQAVNASSAPSPVPTDATPVPSQPAPTATPDVARTATPDAATADSSVSPVPPSASQSNTASEAPQPNATPIAPKS